MNEEFKDIIGYPRCQVTNKGCSGTLKLIYEKTLEIRRNEIGSAKWNDNDRY